MKSTFRMQTMNYCEMARIFIDMKKAKDNLSYRVIMERENKGLSYEYILDKLLNLNHDKYEKYSPDDIRKRLEAKKPKAQLLEDLCNVLEIENENEDLLEVIATYRYHLNRAKVGKGRASQKEIDKRKERYIEIHSDLKLSDGKCLEKTIYEEFSRKENYSYNGIECDWELYCEFMEEDFKREILKKLLVINDYYPEKIEEFLDMFEFDDECNAELEMLDVEIKYL